MRNAVRDINRIFVIALTLSQINVAMLSQIRVQFPDGLINFMVAFDFVNFDLPSITGATCDADIGFTGKFLVLLCLPVFVVFFALLSYGLARARVEHRLNHLMHSSQAREEESIECYQELFHVVDTDNSGLIDASEFVDLLRLCGYEQELKVKLTKLP